MSDHSDLKNIGSPEKQEKIIMATHSSHCGGTCLLKLHVKDGIITRIETDDGEEPQYRACARGRAYRQRVYARDRLLYPMRRLGTRGEGKFERVSWDEALGRVAEELTRVKEAYGPASILFKGSGGDLGRLQGTAAHYRLLCMSGGCSEVWGVHSWEGAIFGQIATFGTVYTSNSRDNLLDSRLIIMWGWNPAETILLTNTASYLAQARERGIKIVSVDPRYTNTAALCATQWIPIRPGTDAAMLISMAYVIINEELQDQSFLDKYTIGFHEFRNYLFGVEDGVPKTPAWAENITGVPADRIINLAKEYARTKPAALMAGIAPGRTAYGEQYHRAASVLAAITGNIGVRGGDAAASAFLGTSGIYPFMKLGDGMPIPPNPVEAKAARRKDALPSYGNYRLNRRGSIHQAKVADAILKGRKGGYPADYRLMYVVNNNFPNQYLNINRCVEALKELEFIVVFEQFMTPGAKFADILLPVNTCLERNDITTGETTGFYGFMGKAIESIGESKSHFEICNALAIKLGITGYSDKTEDEWLKQIALGSPHIQDYAAFKNAGGQKMKKADPYVAFREQVENFKDNPFPTPSGKIEIYCQRLVDLHHPEIPGIPKYIRCWEDQEDPLSRRYPLQLITTHFWRRAHSQYDNIPWLRELDPQSVWMSSADAKARGIDNGNSVRVFNDRGATILTARVTERMMPGVIDIPEGAWYDPDGDGLDRGGSANVLTKDEHSPGGAYPTNTSLVQVEKL